MRAFIVSCLLSLVVAAPQGYNYQQQQQQQPQHGHGQVQFPGIPQLANIVKALQAPQVQQSYQANYNQAAPQQQQQQISYQQTQQQIPNFSVFGQQPHQQQTQQYQQSYQQPQQYTGSYNGNAGASLVSKDIYVHVPPADEPEERYPQQPIPVAPPRKHYRIVFIKAPTPSVPKASLRVQQAPTEEKTIIYVLTKKPDPLDLQAAFEEAAPKPPSKPEVYFIKYKTQEEAAHAQRTIQAQYDQLGGTTQVSDEGIAPVTSVIGSLDNQQQSGASVPSAIDAIPNKYLPAHLRRA